MEKNDLTRQELENLLNEKGEAWAIAALIDGSIGYYSADSARLALRNFAEGADECWSERAMACFEGSMLKMLSHDLGGMLLIEQRCPEKARKLVALGRHLLALDSIDQTTVGLVWPTLNV